MKILIMGIGYVGTPLLESLQSSHHELFVTTTNPSKVEPLKSFAKEVLLINEEGKTQLTELINRCDAMVILVAPVNGASYDDTYLKTADTVIKVLNKREKPFYLLYTSSTSVYEGIDHQSALEDLALRPASENGQILLKAENKLLEWNNTCVLRLGGIFGKNRDLIKRAKNLSEKLMSGSGDEPTNHIHLEDIIKTIRFCLENQPTGIYNLVCDDHPTRKELYDSFCKKLSIPPPVWSNQTSGKKKGYLVSNEKIKLKQAEKFLSLFTQII